MEHSRRNGVAGEMVKAMFKGCFASGLETKPSDIKTQLRGNVSKRDRYIS